MSEWQPIETMPEDNADDVDARFLQAAQSVPVVGEVVAYKWAGILFRPEETHNWRRDEAAELVIKPTHSIPAADLARLREKAAEADELRKDAERYRWLRDDAFEHSDDCFMEAGRLFAEKHGVAFDEAIDAAIAQEGE